MTRFIEIETNRPEVWSTISHRHSYSIYEYAKFVPRGLFLVPILPEGSRLRIPVSDTTSTQQLASSSLPPWKT